VTNTIQNLPWIKMSKSQKGVTSNPPYITMLSTTIMAMIDNQSSLRKYAGNHKNALGKFWTDKHGTFIDIYFNCLLANGIPILTRAKKINAVTLACIGLTTVKTGSCIRMAKYKGNWDMKGDKNLKT
ncbi:hypothetical protein P691DRAFT_686771, partial [Macrolepiota fuliginosa MF-IS2]